MFPLPQPWLLCRNEAEVSPAQGAGSAEKENRQHQGQVPGGLEEEDQAGREDAGKCCSSLLQRQEEKQRSRTDVQGQRQGQARANSPIDSRFLALHADCCGSWLSARALVWVTSLTPQGKGVPGGPVSM